MTEDSPTSSSLENLLTEDRRFPPDGPTHATRLAAHKAGTLREGVPTEDALVGSPGQAGLR